MILKFTQSRWLLVLVLLASSLAMIQQIPTVCGSVHAAQGQSPSDYCFQTDVAVTYAGVGTLTDYPVRVEIPAAAMVSADQLDPRGWDILSQQGSFTNNQHLLIQETGDTLGAAWIIVPSISAAGGDEDFRWYSGQNDRRRDQSVYFTGGEYVDVADHADLDVNDLLDVEITLTNHSDTARSEWILDKWGGSAGYGVAWVDNASTLELRWRLDGATCDLVWDPTWTDLKQDLRFNYTQAVGNDAFIYVNGNLEQSCDLDQSLIASNAEDLRIGSNEVDTAPTTSTEIHRVTVRDAGVRMAAWDFSANHMEELTETNPYTGTVADVSGNGHTGTYTFDRDQTDLTTSVAATTAINLVGSGLFVATLDNIVDVIGDPVVNDVGTPQTDSIFYRLFLEPLEDLGPSSKTTFALVLTALGLALGIGVFVMTDKRFMPLAATIAGFPVWLGALNDWVEWWYAGTWAMIVLFTWFAFRRSEESA